jgi:hypothetical protein
MAGDAHLPVARQDRSSRDRAGRLAVTVEDLHASGPRLKWCYQDGTGSDGSPPGADSDG